MPVLYLEPETDDEQSPLAPSTQRMYTSNRNRQSPRMWKPITWGMVRTDPKRGSKSRN